MARYIVISDAFVSNLHSIIDTHTGECVHREGNFEQAEYICGRFNRGTI